MVEIVESAAERKERKRLKKLAKQAAASQVSPSASLLSSPDLSPNQSDADSTKAAATTESAAEKKERKKLKKLAKAKMAVVEAAAAESEKAEAEKLKKKNKKEKKRKSLDNSSLSVDSNANKPEKKANKRKMDDWNQMMEKEAEDTAAFLARTAGKENGAPAPASAWSKIMKNRNEEKNKDEEPPAKKKKKEKKVVKYEEKKISIPVEESGTFKKIFYRQTAASLAVPEQEVTEFRAKHKMNLSGRGAEQFTPVFQFKDFSTDSAIMAVCQGFERPTPIQSQCWPIIGSGRDIIGIAETGSGKTLAFSLPALPHLLHRWKNPVQGLPRNPAMLVLSPTRELAMQTQVTGIWVGWLVTNLLVV